MIKRLEERKSVATNADFQNGEFVVSSSTKALNLPKSSLQNPRFNRVTSWVKRLSLRTKVLMFAFTFSTLPVLGIGSLTHYLINQLVTQEIFKQDKTSYTNTENALAKQRQLLLLLEAGTVIVAFLIGGIAAILANRLTQVIIAAATAVNKLGQGDLNTRIAIEGEDELAILGSNINEMADQIQNLLQKQTEEAEQLKLLTNILLLVRSSLNSEDLFNITVTQARLLLKADRVVIYQFNAGGSGQILAESVAPGLPIDIGNTIKDDWIPPGIIEAYREGRALSANDVLQAGLSPKQPELMEQLQSSANLVMPILNDDQVFGFLIAHHELKTHVWQPYEVNLLRQLAVQVGLTIERVSLLEATQALKDFAIQLSAILNSEDIYSLAVHDIRKALKAERAVIYNFDDNLLGSVIAESVIPDWPRVLGTGFHESIGQNHLEKYQQGCVIAVNNIYQADLPASEITQLEQFAVKANVAAPILLGEKLLGLLIVHQCSQPRLWQQSEINLCEQFAKTVGLALERANLLEQTEKGRIAAEIVSQQQRQQKEQMQLQLLRLQNDIEGASRGDLTVRAEVTSGEIGTVADFFNSILESWRGMVTQIKAAAVQVDNAIAQNSKSFDKIAIASVQQTNQINTTLDFLEQLTATIPNLTKNATQAVTLAQTASRTAANGGATMDLTVANIMNLHQTIEKTTKKVKSLGESSQEISRVVALLNHIAMQTNLLSINAEIEAIRLDEDGHFVVVAKKVAALAAKGAAATQEIEGVMAKIQVEISEVVKAMELSTTQVIEETLLVQGARQNLSNVFHACCQIDQLLQSISTVIGNQVQTSQGVTDTVKEIANVAGVVNHLSDELSESLEKTVKISQDLQASVSVFNVS